MEATLANVAEKLWITDCYNYLEGIAFEMAIAANKSNRSWNQFKEDLIRTFRPVNKNFNLRAKLIKLQESESFVKTCMISGLW